MTKVDELYYAAIRADDDFGAAIKKQFGNSATRWTVSRGDFNQETLLAYRARLAALDALRAEWDRLAGRTLDEE